MAKSKLALGLDMTHVPFSGAGPAVTATVAGHTPIAFLALPAAAPHLLLQAAADGTNQPHVHFDG